MKFLIDMNLSPEIAKVLNEAGYESVHWNEIGQANAEDAILFEWARTNDYVIVTLDLDFGTLLSLTHLNRPSVIQIRREDVDPIHLQSVLVEVFREYSDAINEGALMVVDDKKIRLRKLPL